MFRHNLVELRPDAREAVLENLDTHERETVALRDGARHAADGAARRRP